LLGRLRLARRGEDLIRVLISKKLLLESEARKIRFQIWDKNPLLELTLPPIKHASPEHHIPNLVRIPRVLTNHEPLEMFLDQPTSRWSTETCRITDGPVGGGEFDEDRTEDADTPRSSGGSVFGVFMHWAGDVAGDDYATERASVSNIEK